MKKFVNETFEDFYDEDSSEIFENLIFEKCKFEYCEVSQTENPVNRSIVRNIELKNCSIKGGSLGCAIVENVLIDGLRTSGLTILNGAVFNKVVFKGKIGRFFIKNDFDSFDEETENAFKEENRLFYKNVEWALDISEAEFSELDLRGIPSDLVKRNKENQVIVRRQNIPSNWKEIKFNDRITPVFLDSILALQLDDKIYSTSTRDKHYESMKQDIQLLRELGIADLD